ncbi:MAG: Lon protease family protein, partial [Anaerolineales bacterium]|nr:Lon protease family protein [Anaerolineales bacterium]
ENEDDQTPAEWFRRYKVNVIIDNQANSQAPVVAEYDPQLSRLVGRVEHEARYGGAVVTDFTLLRAGALHTANGGYLILRAQDLFAEAGAWEALKRALVGRELRPDDPAIRGGAPTRTLDPDPIPLQVKVILIGPPVLYFMLLDADEDFGSIFKVMADFDYEVERTPENELDYAHFIGRLCHDEKLRHLTADAVGLVIEQSARLAGTQNRLSTRFGQLADLVREANHWADQADREFVAREDVLRAIDNRRYLRNRVEMRLLEMLLDGKRLIATSEAVVGQINALTVSQVGDHSFGQPNRVTVRTYVGKSGVIQIDREVALAGPIHNKGLMTLVGYLGGQYAGDHPLSLNAQITFEQSYGGIEGDSASSTELYALLSSLAGIPISQAIAVTGSVNQHGEIQPIGGVTEKVEGWFNVCRQRGLTGDQGCMIPAANIQDLMLDHTVIEAVAAGQFHIWAVRSVDEGIELLTGRSATDVHTAVAARLGELAEKMRQYEAR